MFPQSLKSYSIQTNHFAALGFATSMLNPMNSPLHRIHQNSMEGPMVLEGLGGGKRHGRATCHGVPGLLCDSLIRFSDG